MEFLWTTQSGGAEWGDWCEGSRQHRFWAQETQSTRCRDHNILCWSLYVSPLSPFLYRMPSDLSKLQNSTMTWILKTLFHSTSCTQQNIHSSHFFLDPLCFGSQFDWLTSLFDWCRANLYEDEEEIKSLLKFKPWWRELSQDSSVNSDTCETFTSSHSLYHLLKNVL